MLATEQTVVLLGRMTSFTAVCEACQEEQRAELLEESWLGARVSGRAPRVGDRRGRASRAVGSRGKVGRDNTALRRALPVPAAATGSIASTAQVTSSRQVGQTPWTCQRL